MSALFVRPLSFSVVAGNAATIAPISNTNSDEPGLSWQSANLTTVYCIIDLGATAVSYDTIALIGTNLRASDTVQIRTGTTSTGIGNYAGTALAAWSGNKPDLATAKSIYGLGTARTERYIRIDITSTGNPDGFVEVQRIVVGKAIKTDGVAYDAEMGFVDRSIITDGAGYRTVDEYDVIPTIKFRVANLSETAWDNDWYPLLQWAGIRRAVLVITSDVAPDKYQTRALFGPIAQKPGSGKSLGYNAWSVEATVQALSQ